MTAFHSSATDNVTCAGGVPDVLSGCTVCIACPQTDAYSETFIRTHIERLPMKVRVLAGKPPHTDRECGFIYRKGLQRKLLENTLGRFVRFDEQTWGERTMAGYFQKFGIRAVLAEYGTTGISVMQPAQRAGVPLIVHFHGNDAYNTRILSDHREDYARLFAASSAVVAVSRDMQQQLISLGAPTAKVHYIPYWVDADQFDDARPAEAPPLLLAVGRFVEKKAPHLTLLAFEKALQQVPEARLTMIGDGPLLGTCKHLVQHFGMEQHVAFPGSREHGFVRDRMAQVRAFVQHSVRASDGDCEGTPLSVTEAQASGLPVVATRHMGIKDVVVDGQTGLLVDEFDVDGMAEAMVRLLREPQTASRMGQEGRGRVLALFSYSHTLQRLSDLLQAASTP
jgi:colanic acid/amylovoran biosynthesis glycosyltransferase